MYTSCINSLLGLRSRCSWSLPMMHCWSTEGLRYKLNRPHGRPSTLTLNIGLPLPPAGELLLIAGGYRSPIRGSSRHHTTTALINADTTTLVSPIQERWPQYETLYMVCLKRGRESCARNCIRQKGVSRKYCKTKNLRMLAIPLPNIQTNALF